MIYKVTLFSFFIFFSFLFHDLYSQDSSKEFNDLRKSILSEMAAKDIDEALSYTDTLGGMANTRIQEIKVEMTRAVLHNQQGNIEEALNIAMEAEKAFRENKNYPDQLGVIGFIAANFREIGLNKEALYYLNKASRTLDKIKDEHLKGQYGALLNHEKVALYTLKEDYEKVEKAIAEAYKYINLIDEGGQKSFFLATTLYLEANNKWNKENFNQAEKIFNRAKEILGTKNDLLYGQIQVGLAKIYLEHLDYIKTKNIIEEIESMVENSQYYQLKKDFYELSSSYYFKTGNIGQYKKYNNLYNENQALISSKSRQIADESVAQLRLKVASKQKRVWYISTVMGIAGLALIVVLIINYRRNKKRNQRFKEIIEKLRSGRTIESSSSSTNDKRQSMVQEESLNQQNTNGEGIAKDTEQRILKELSRLESTADIYLQSDISLSKLATLTDTNTKYLTLIIKKHKNKNFTTYVNDFRINYILKELQENPKYLEYKISYLADQSGFSSHSKFSSEFKRVVGMSPSVFIKQLKSA